MIVRILFGICSLQSLLKTVHFVEKNVTYHKNANSENGRVENPKRVNILIESSNVVV